MIIANPIYDVVFKSMMEDVEIARGLIGGLIGRGIVSIETRTNEIPLSIESGSQSVTIYRLDYVAVVREKDGSTRRILVEVQKAKLGSEVRRFREYLGKQYMTPEYKPGSEGKLFPFDPPIVTIYILGFDLDPAVPPYAKVNRQIINALTGKPASAVEEFVESLTHDMFILQTRKLSHKASNDVGRLLSIFAQSDFAEADSQLTIDLPDKLTKAKGKLFRRILRHLHKLAADAKTRDVMEREDRSYKEFEYLVMKQQMALLKKLEEAKAREEEERHLKEEAKAREENERRLKEEAKAREEEAKAREEEAKAREEEAKAREEEAKAREEEAKTREETERRLKEEALVELDRLRKQLANDRG